MAIQTINIGALPNDGTGDPMRSAFSKANSNFTELAVAKFSTAQANTVGITSGQVLFQTPLAQFTQASFQINSRSTVTADSQNISLSVASVNNGTAVQSVSYAPIGFGTPIATYSTDVNAGNVRVLCDSLTADTVTHLITYQITVSA